MLIISQFLRKKITHGQVLLKNMFVNNQDITKLKLQFVLDATTVLTKSVSFFEESQVDVHNAMGQVLEIMTTQYRRIFPEECIYDLDDEEALKLKPTKKLVELDLVKTKVLDEKMLFIGQSAETEIKKLGLRPNSLQLSWFIQKVRRFHIKACEFLQKYFKPVLTSKVLECAEALNPEKLSHVLTSRRLKYLVDQYSTIVKNIQKIGGVDQVKNEIDKYITDVDVRLIDHSKGFEHSWKEVSKLKKGSGARYDVLGRFALATGPIYTATSDVERQFSKMNLIHQFKQRNCISHETLNAHLTVRGGMENCVKSMYTEENIKPGHCQLAITTSLKEMCQNLYKVVKSSSIKITEDRKKELKDRKGASDELERVRIDKLKEKQKNDKVILTEENLKPVFVDKKADESQSKKKDDKSQAKEKADESQAKKNADESQAKKKADGSQSKKKKDMNDNINTLVSKNGKKTNHS